MRRAEWTPAFRARLGRMRCPYCNLLGFAIPCFALRLDSWASVALLRARGHRTPAVQHEVWLNRPEREDAA